MSDAVDRLNAALEGRYAIERELGEGGMACKVRAIYVQILNRWYFQSRRSYRAPVGRPLRRRDL